MICLKKISSLAPLCYYYFFFSWVSFFLVSLLSVTFLHCVICIAVFLLGFCVCLFSCVLGAVSVFRLSHLPNFSFHAEMGGWQGHVGQHISDIMKLMVVTGCPLERQAGLVRGERVCGGHRLYRDNRDLSVPSSRSLCPNQSSNSGGLLSGPS